MKTSKKNVIKTPDPFADTLHVRQISKTSEDIKTGGRNQGTDFKRDKNLNQFSRYDRPDRGPRLDETGLQYFIPETKKEKPIDNNYGKIRIRRQLKKAPVGSTVKMISMNMPKFGRGQAIVQSSFDNVSDYKIREDTVPYSQISLEKSGGLTNTEPKNLLEEAQKEIDISQNQLQRIHSILKNKNPEANAVDKPKWNPPQNKVKEHRDSKERVVSTLSNLNKKLSDMQQKYFSQKKPSFKSIDDIPCNLTAQSNSEIDVVESNSDNEIQLGKNEIFRKLGLMGMQENLLEKQKSTLSKATSYSEENNETSENRNKIAVAVERHLDRRSMIEKDFSEELNLYYNSSQNIFEKNMEREKTIVANNSSPNSASNADDERSILERFHSTKKERIQDNSYQKKIGITNRENLSTKCFDRGQNFSTSISDVLLNKGFPSDLSMMNLASQKFQDKNCPLGLSLDSTDIKTGNESMMEASDIFCDANSLFDSHNSTRKYKKMEEIQEILLTEDEKNYIKRGNLNKQQTEMSESKYPSIENSLVNVPKSKEVKKLQHVKSKTSNTDFYDCNSKVQGTLNYSGMPNKKIFYDNFGRYSKKFNEEYHKSNEDINSATNLANCPFAIDETESDKSIFDDTVLQESVLKSDYLRKTFILKPSKPLGDAKQIEISKNRSDQFFNEVLDLKNSETKNTKNMKNMYSALTQALSNSFYTITPQN